ncbi:MAG: hypothetical protein ACHQ01_02480, partial [Candidatus Limnocylindrales bacterium]
PTLSIRSTPSPSAPPTPCQGTHPWPPNGYGPAPVGVTAEMPNGAVVGVVNATDSDYWYRVSIWRDQDCLGWVLDHEIGDLEFEYERGPLPKHSRVDTAIGYTSSRPEDMHVGVGIWDHRCGEACSDRPIGFLTVTLSTIVPLST